MMRNRDQVVWLAFAAILLMCGGVRSEEPSLTPLDVQNKIDAAFAHGGGEVRIGPGDYEAKPFVLKSGITLNLLEGATVYASTNVADYAAARGERCFIFAEGATNVSIVGKGTINGRGWAFRESRGLPGESQPQDLPVMIRLSRCRDVRLEDFTYRDCGAWGCHLRNCDGVVVRRVKCVSHVNNTNDGIDIESSNVLIEDCDIDSDDDAIVFKTESDLSFQVTNVIVRNCRLASCCNALKFGTGSYCDFRDITVEDCVFSRAKYNYRFEWFKLAPGVTNAICGIAGMALEVVDGGRMDNVVIRNIDIEGYQTPIFIREERRHEPQPGRETYLRNVRIEHVKGVADSRIACSITGTPGRRPSDITLRNVDLAFPGGGTEEDVACPVPELETAYPDSCMFGFKPLPAFGFYLRHADDVTFENVRLRTLTPDARKPIVTEDCNGFRESAAGVIQGELLRPDAPGCPLLTDARTRWNAKTGCFEPNTDENKVAPYVLEDPLTFANGEKLRSAADWPKRRAEILDIFARKIYGEEPPPPAALSWDLLEEKDGAIAGYAKRRVYRMHFTADKSGPAVDWGLWLPRHAKGRVPVVLFLNYRGIQEIDGDKSIPLCRGWSRRRPSLGVPEHLATEGTRGVLQDADNPSHLPIQTILARGYAILSASYTDVSPDPDPFGADGVDQYAFATTNGVFTLWGTRDESRTDNITSLGAWAWALSRGLDLALAQPEIDPNRTVVTGCSRLGKAAFLAAARDERFAVCVPNQCGGGGVCLAKRDFGENVSTENAMFTHWYCKAYRRYAANPAVLMDFDMHLLLAAIAPRRVLVEGFGPNDWMDTKAEYLAAVAASPAWEFLGVPGLPKTGFPDYYDESAIGPYLGYVRRTEGHGISGYDWNWLLNFADAAWTSGS